MRSLTHTRDDERRAGGDDPHRGGVDAGQLDENVQRGWVVGAVAVALGQEATPLADEARHFPEVGEKLLDLPLKIAQVAAPGHVRELPGGA